MKDFFKNMGLLVVVLGFSYLTAPYFGNWYDRFSPQYGGWLTSNEQAISFAGFFVAYMFFIPFIYRLAGFKRGWWWVVVLLIPPALLWVFADTDFIYLPAIVAVIGLLLAKLIRLVISKLKHPNPPMVVK